MNTISEVFPEQLSLRDYFAAKAMQALMLDRDYTYAENGSIQVAKLAYEYARQMLVERER